MFSNFLLFRVYQFSLFLCSRDFATSVFCGFSCFPIFCFLVSTNFHDFCVLVALQFPSFMDFRVFPFFASSCVQQPLGIVGFLTKLCFFLFCAFERELRDFGIKGIGTSRPVGEVQKKLKGSRD